MSTIHVKKTALADAMSIALRAVDSRTKITALHCLRFAGSEGGRLMISGTSLNIQITTTCEAEITGDVGFCIEGARFLAIINAVADEEIHMEIERARGVHVRSGSARFRLHTVDVSDFPFRGDDVGESVITMKQEDLLRALASVADAVNDNEDRGVLNCVFVDWSGGTSVATDGKRAHLQGVEMLNQSRELVLAQRAVKALSQCLTTGTVKIDQNPVDSAVFLIEQPQGFTRVWTKRVEGAMPPYRRVIPVYPNAAIDVDREELMAAIRRAALTTDEKHSSIKMKVAENILSLSAFSAEGENEEVISLAKLAPFDVEWAFNPKFMRDALDGALTERVSLSFSRENPARGPILITADKFTAVIMPVTA